MSHTEIYLKDFIPSLPYPPCFKICKEDLDDYIKNPLQINYTTFEGKKFSNYPRLFGEKFRNVWFSGNALSTLSNHDLYCLENFFLTEEDRNLLLDHYSGAPIFVLSITYPIQVHPCDGVVIIK